MRGAGVVGVPGLLIDWVREVHGEVDVLSLPRTHLHATARFG